FLSLKYQFEYGSYFRKYDLDFDPFYIGGYDSFLGAYSRERSAPIYKINTLAFRFKIMEKLFADFQYNVLNLGNSDVWLPEENLYHGFGVKIGYDSLIGPLRFAVACDQDLDLYYYLNIGYDFDAFEYSRR
ncbi:MAG: hypothetical protein JW996_01985, partial [Candidatus Cloacimonetes bacterium]|nr:hypothetical protein [Candidatus Cloacimonadota bacterium]